MEAYLRSVQGRLSERLWDGPVHAVLGGPHADLDTVAATLCLALHLDQSEQSDSMCVPVLWLWRGDAPLPEDTLRLLRRLHLPESLLLWRDHLDLLTLKSRGTLTLTVLREGLLDSPECLALKSSVRRVAYHRGQQETEVDEVLTTVAREILQEAAERVGAVLGEALGEALRQRREDLWLKNGRRSEEMDDLLSYLEQLGHRKPNQKDWEQLLTKGAKEFSDGETTIVLTSVTTDREENHALADRLRSFCQRHGYDSAVLLLSVSEPVCHSRQQVAVYANNTTLLSQICCELEESSSWSLSGALDGKQDIQVYHIPVNTVFPGTPPVLEEEIQGLLKDFVNRRNSVLACHPSSRTSSTEGVAGSIDFSQGSSGITDMDGGDMDRGDMDRGDTEAGDGAAEARAVADGEENPGAGGAVELVSPDSGMTTIRSSRSSKESSVFLSDESPLGEVLAAGGPSGPGQFLRNPSPLGLQSLSPPVPPERRRNRSNRNKTDNVDLFCFDPLHSTTLNPEADTIGQPSSSELEELSLVDFSAPTSLSGFDSRNSSIDFHFQTVVPPTPVNSLVGSRPPSSCGVRFFPEDVIERINGLQHKDSISSSLSETWDEFSFDAQGAMSSSENSSWNVAKTCESPQNVLEIIKGDESNNDAKEDISKSDSSKIKGLEPQLSLIVENTELHDKWNSETVISDTWNPVTLADLQLTPPEEEVVVKRKTVVLAVKDKKSKKKELPQTLTPDTSKEEEDEDKKGAKNPVELLDFWTYSAQKGLLKSDSGTTTSYPESLDMWNMTIRDDSLSPLNTPDCLSENSGSFCGASNNVSVESPQGVDKGMAMWNTTIREDSSSTIASPEGNGKDLSGATSLESSPVGSEGKPVHTTNVVEKVQMNEANVRIVIETAEQDNVEDILEMDETQCVLDNTEHASDPWELPVPGMVTSTSEYDNIGGGTWSLSSSPDSSLNVDLIQLDAQSSPFVGVTQTKGEENDCSTDQMFTFEGPKASDNIEKVKDSETLEQLGDHSPFMFVEVNQCTQMEQTVSTNVFNWDELISNTEQATVRSGKDEIIQGLSNKSDNQFSKTVGSGSVEDREGLKYSPDSLHPGSQDELRSSDGDSSSGLEMESIIVSGTVKETERDRPDVKVIKKSMETFSMLSYAATILQAQSAHRHKDTSSEQSQSASTTVSIPKIVSPSLESLNKSDSKLTREDDKPTVPPRSTSPSLRFPSDHFLKTREEVYVHSQISMEDSDEGGQSPSAMPPSSLGDIQAWSEQLERQDTHETPQSHSAGSSELTSPVVTNSSESHSSSYTESPLSETGHATERGLALPFSGDLMEEENEEEDTEEEAKEQSVEQQSGHTQLCHRDETPRDSCQWTEGESAPPAHTQYGYNYHHIDQRTEHQSVLLTQTGPKGSSWQQQPGEVYAEFTSVSGSEQYHEQRGGTPYSSEPYLTQSTFEEDPSHYRRSEDQSQYSSEQPPFPPDTHTGREDHARYVSDGYVHFLLSRETQQEDGADMGSREDPEDMDNREDPPSSADVSAGSAQRRKLSAPPLNVSLEQSEGSLLSEDALDSEEETGDELDINMDDMDTPDEADSVDFDPQVECGAAVGAATVSSDTEERAESRLWRSVLIGEQEHRIDMKSIEPYKRVISHGGYYEEQHAIIVFAACFLPDSDCDNYNYVMENLFLYVISTLELMVAEDYMIVYLNGATPRRRMPGFSWMKKCYQMIDRRLKKNLKMFIIVHPSFFIRTLLGITRPFISSKFSSKIKYVHSLHDLGQIIPMEYVHIPPSIISLDSELQETTCKSDRKRSSAV